MVGRSEMQNGLAHTHMCQLKTEKAILAMEVLQRSEGS